MTVREAARAILAFYDGKPERWCQKVMAKDADGFTTPCRSPYARAWCIGGAYSCIRPAGRELGERVALQQALGGSFIDFNDAPGRTFAEVVAALEAIASEGTP